jgi:hypothetical protein
MGRGDVEQPTTPTGRRERESVREIFTKDQTMAVRQSKPKFVASDGEKFDSQEDAERYDLLIEAKRVFDSAKRSYDRALARSQKTADGEPFEGFDTHWHVGWFRGEARCCRVSFYEYELRVETDGTIEIKPYGEKDVYLPIKELYRYEKNARKKYAEYLREQRDRLDKEIERAETTT